MFAREPQDVLLEDLEGRFASRVAPLEVYDPKPVKVHAPDLHGLLFLQWRVVDLDLHTGLESLVQRTSAVGSEEEDAVVVLPGHAGTLIFFFFALEYINHDPFIFLVF